MGIFNGLGFGNELCQPWCHPGLRSSVEDRGRNPRFGVDEKTRGKGHKVY